MKQAFLIAWLLSPLAALAWHYGPGQAQLAHETVGDLVHRAETAAAADDFKTAVALYDRALEALPVAAETEQDELNPAAGRRIRLAQAQARIQSGEMVEGQEQLQDLLLEMQGDADADPKLIAGTRNELATASYYAAWIMRLEGATELEWLPEAERARQQFRLLAERTTAEEEEEQVEPFLQNLEAVVRLEQMDLSTLKAKPVPKQCPSCKNLSQRKRKQCQSRCNSNGKKESKDGKQKKPAENDARKEIKKTNKAGINQRKGTGS